MSKLVPISVSDKQFDVIASKITESYPNACVSFVEKINNSYLIECYESRKESIIKCRGLDKVKEIQVFHGTKHNNIDSIIENGFKVRWNETSAYGRGTYFSTRANYSKNYSNIDPNEFSYMFICNIIVGNCIKGSNDMTINTELYDNAVDNLKRPSIYVTPYDDGCLPIYLVAFHKNAK